MMLMMRPTVCCHAAGHGNDAHDASVRVLSLVPPVAMMLVMLAIVCYHAAARANDANDALCFRFLAWLWSAPGKDADDASDCLLPGGRCFRLFPDRCIQLFACIGPARDDADDASSWLLPCGRSMLTMMLLFAGVLGWSPPQEHS